MRRFSQAIVVLVLVALVVGASAGAKPRPATGTTATLPSGTAPTAAGVAARSGPAIKSFTPTAGPPGTLVLIKGTGLSHVSGVSFGGVPSTAFLVYGSKLYAVVPHGAVSGPITVTTNLGPATSAAGFSVLKLVDLTSCLNDGGSMYIPSGSGVFFEALWEMTSSAFLKPFLKNAHTDLAVNGVPVKGAGKLWDKKGGSDGNGNWLTALGYPAPTVLQPGQHVTARFHVFAVRSLSDGATTYPAGADLWPDFTCTVTAAVPPVLGGFEPTSGTVGTVVRISGENLQYVTGVDFAGKSATFTHVSTTEIDATVPNGASSGPITLEASTFAPVDSTQSFTVLFPQPPTIDSFEPASATPGTQLTIHGTGLSWVRQVRFGMLGPYVSVPAGGSDTQLTVTVPGGATSGPITVFTDYASATTPTDFTYVPRTTWGAGTGSVVVDDLDPSRFEFARTAAVDANGKLLVAGEDGEAANFFTAPELVRLNPDGSLDTSFGANGVEIPAFADSSYYKASALAVQPDGKILLAGTVGINGSTSIGGQLALARFLPDGTPDSTFDGDGLVTTQLFSAYTTGSPCGLGRPKMILEDSAVLLVVEGCSPTQVALARYLPDGSLDQSFGTGGLHFVPGTDSGFDLAAARTQSDGKIVVAGSTGPFGNQRFAALRLNVDGSLDSSYGTNGVQSVAATAPATARNAVVDSAGRLVIVGDESAIGNGTLVLARLTTSGALDTGFATGGVAHFDPGTITARAVSQQSDGKLIVTAADAVVRFGANGALDTGFGNGGLLEAEFGAAWNDGLIGADGNLYAVGNSNSDGFAVGRYLTAP